MAERDEKGKFVKGSSGNPRGRLPKEREEKYYEIMAGEATPDRWREIIRTAIRQAERGDAQARKWLSDYLMGPPVQRAEVSGADGANIAFDLFVRAVDKVYGSN